MPRTIVDIPAAQLREVDRICQSLRISRAEAVRQALVEFVQRNDVATVEGFGLWLDGNLTEWAHGDDDDEEGTT